MAEFEQEDGMTRDDLVQRVALMEAMIAEGRQYTGRNAWIFVLWGLVDLTAWAWQNSGALISSDAGSTSGTTDGAAVKSAISSAIGANH